MSIFLFSTFSRNGIGEGAEKKNATYAASGGWLQPANRWLVRPQTDMFWSALHGMEAVGGYEQMLLQYFRRWPSLMTKAMLQRILNSGQMQIGGVAIKTLITT